MLVLTDEQIKRLMKMAGQGLNLKQMAALIDVSDATLDRLIERDSRVKEAIEKGRAEASEAITNTAYRLASSGRHPAMTMFWLKCRERWKETSVHELSGPDGKPIETKDASTIPEADLDAKISDKLARLGIAKPESTDEST